LNESVGYLLQKGVAKVVRSETRLTRRLLTGLTRIDGVTVYGPPTELPRAAVVSFNLRGLDPVLVADELERRGDIACRPGWHCAALAHRTQGTQKTGTVRLSPGPFTKMTEIETVLGIVAELAAEHQA
jgi:selenocysteine lyase/cysteine desulfurase